MIILVGCGEPLQLDGTPGLPRTPLIVPATSTSGALFPSATASGVAATEAANTVVPSAAPEPSAIPEPSTTATPAAVAATPSPSPAVIIVLPTAPGSTSEDRWLAQQLSREEFDPPRNYTAVRPVELRWYDPQTGQSLEIGRILGDFPALAEVVLRGSQERALIVEYTINADFGLTAISEALRSRMASAGYTESVEAYVVLTDAVEPREQPAARSQDP